MLSAFDDLPVHQTTDPIARPASTDPNAFERYTFHGHEHGGDEHGGDEHGGGEHGGTGVAFAATLALYPQLETVDASFTIVQRGRQRTVRASGRLAPGDRTTAVGPFHIEVIEPLRRLRVVVAEHGDDLGVVADLLFTATTEAVELPYGHAAAPAGAVTAFDRPQLTQWGSWTGRLTVDGESVLGDRDRWPGHRDRAWGARPLGNPPAGAPRHELPQLFWLRASVSLPGLHLHAAVAEDAAGRRWVHQVHAVPGTGTDDPMPTTGTDDPAIGTGPAGPAIGSWRDVHVDLSWIPGTRRVRHATLTFVPWCGPPLPVRLEPRTEFAASGLGYADALWGHAVWKDESSVGSEAWPVAGLDPDDVRHLHRYVVATATVPAGGEHGTTGHGTIEILAVGPHARSGLTGFTDGFAADPTDRPAGATADLAAPSGAAIDGIRR